MKKKKVKKEKVAAPAVVEEAPAAPAEVPAAAPAEAPAPTVGDIINAAGNTILVVGKGETPIQQHPRYNELAAFAERFTNAYMSSIALTAQALGLQIDTKIFLMTKDVTQNGPK